RVVYTRSGQYLAACRIEDPESLIEQTLYWSSVESVEEGRYLCAVLNSGTLAEAILPLQSQGQHNPRDFAMSLFAVPFPKFDKHNPLHCQLAVLAERAERVVNALVFDDAQQFQRARRIAREALQKDGVAQDIDGAVSELLGMEVASQTD